MKAWLEVGSRTKVGTAQPLAAEKMAPPVIASAGLMPTGQWQGGWLGVTGASLPMCWGLWGTLTFYVSASSCRTGMEENGSDKREKRKAEICLLRRRPSSSSP